MDYKLRAKLLKRMLFILPIALLIFTFSLYSLVDSKSNHTEADYFVKNNDSSPKIAQFKGERIVHLDLKGAPPRVSYYEALFPFLSKIGVTGILIEYEDMFPYSGELLQHIPAYNAYSLNDIQYINGLAEKHKLTIIPLIQTFGHLEFILKLKKFSYLREVPQYPQVICPSQNVTISVLFDMVNQVIKAHPKSQSIHIGADEVYDIGKCNLCQDIMFKEQITVSHLFLTHIKHIAMKIKFYHPKLKILMWDDEFRKINLEELKHSAVNLLVEPVVWKYTEDVVGDLGFNLFDKYASTFKTVWLASAFKGATGPNKYLTPIGHHISNHRSWMQVYSEYKNKMQIRGILITGWQRYDHFAVLCELLPVGIPSLAFSLGVLLDNNNNTNMYGLPFHFQDLLDCSNPSALMTTYNGLPHCNFPGGEILDAVMDFNNIVEKFESIKRYSSVQGWLTNYNNEHNFTNVRLVNDILNDLPMVLGTLGILTAQIENALIKVYDKFTVVEWIETYLIPIQEEMQKMLEMLNKFLVVSDWPRRPF